MYCVGVAVPPSGEEYSESVYSWVSTHTHTHTQTQAGCGSCMLQHVLAVAGC